MAPGATMSATPAFRPALADVSSSLPVGGAGLRPHVTIRGLSKRFDKAVIYDKFDLDIPRGELISVFGPNGCGKSTLINIIAGLIPADAGQVLFDGMLLNEIKFGYVFKQVIVNHVFDYRKWYMLIKSRLFPRHQELISHAARKDRVYIGRGIFFNFGKKATQI